MITVDFKDGFHHVLIHPDFTKYLGIEWDGEFYEWQVLPFGVQCAPYYFYKVVHPMIIFLCKNGIRIAPFVDDFMLMAQQLCMMDHKDFLLDTLHQCGWLINHDKCQHNSKSSSHICGVYSQY